MLCYNLNGVNYSYEYCKTCKRKTDHRDRIYNNRFVCINCLSTTACVYCKRGFNNVFNGLRLKSILKTDKGLIHFNCSLQSEGLNCL